jgi:hypothetical protein
LHLYGAVRAMQVRIIKSAEGIIDGVSLAHLIPGLTYDLEISIARYLVEKDCAEETPLSVPALVIPLDNARAYAQLTRGVTVVPPRAEAADTRRRRPRGRKRR